MEATEKTERITLDVPEVARRLGISRAAAYYAVKRGQIPHLKIGKRILIPRAALDRFLAGAEPSEGL